MGRLSVFGFGAKQVELKMRRHVVCGRVGVALFVWRRAPASAPLLPPVSVVRRAALRVPRSVAQRKTFGAVLHERHEGRGGIVPLILPSAPRWMRVEGEESVPLSEATAVVSRNF